MGIIPCSLLDGLITVPSACMCLHSGMLPGYVSGFYSYNECHVDLNRLARYANARMILQPATGLDLKVCICVCVCQMRTIVLVLTGNIVQPMHCSRSIASLALQIDLSQGQRY